MRVRYDLSETLPDIVDLFEGAEKPVSLWALTRAQSQSAGNNLGLPGREELVVLHEGQGRVTERVRQHLGDCGLREECGQTPRLHWLSVSWQLWDLGARGFGGRRMVTVAEASGFRGRDCRRMVMVTVAKRWQASWAWSWVSQFLSTCVENTLSMSCER